MKDLDEYFDKAARQGEIVPLAEISNLLSRKEPRAKNHAGDASRSFFRRREFAFAAFGMCVIVVGAIVLLSPVRHGRYAGQEVFVPLGQRRVMHLVKNISEGPENREIRVSQFGRGDNPQVSGIPIHLRSKFELSEEKLKLLGVTITDTLIKYEGNVKGKGYVSFLVPKMKNWTSVSVDDRQRADVKEYEFYPWFMSGEDGRQGVRYRFEKEPAAKMTQSFFDDVVDELVPIQVDRPGFRKVIFWFSQTPALMDILETAAMVSENDEAPGEADTDVADKTIQVEIFPTITKGEVNVVASVLKKQKLEIALLNSSGDVVQIAVDKDVVDKGDHQFTMDLSSFRQGLFFVRIKSEPGMTTIHRVFRE
jgi:hypothetical protein